jgi:hypothetical protein
MFVDDCLASSKDEEDYYKVLLAIVERYVRYDVKF